MEALDYQPPRDPIHVLHQDAALLLVDKPAGLLSVPGKDPAQADCLESRVAALDAEALLVHRLDMDTSGVMVFARNKAAQRHLGLQFERRVLEKEYVALVEGNLEGDAGCIEAPIASDWPNRPLQKICHKSGRAAVTDWEVLERSGNIARVLLRPRTGRTHQLRVHMASLGTPIQGDRFYAGATATRLMLHARRLHLRHPDGGAWSEFNSDVPF